LSNDTVFLGTDK